MDGTLTPLTTMFELLLFDAEANGRMEEGLGFLARLRRIKTAGAPREETNREYFRWWAGRDVAEVSEAGLRWFHQTLTDHGQSVVFERMRARLDQHRAMGHEIVLVSGSFAPALSSLADHIGADEVLATEPVVRHGKYTGEIASSMIGQGKAAAVAAHASRRKLCLELSHGYGDDISDVPFMELTGHPVAVNSSGTALAVLSQRPGWSRLNTY